LGHLVVVQGRAEARHRAGVLIVDNALDSAAENRTIDTIQVTKAQSGDIKQAFTDGLARHYTTLTLRPITNSQTDQAKHSPG